MNTTAKKKLCWNCEGNVAQHLEHCPYCGVYLSPMTNLEDEEDSLLKPPYPLSPTSENEKIPQAPYSSTETEVGTQETVLHDDIIRKKVLVSLLLIQSGVVFFLFGFILFLFTENNTFTLSWSGDYWYLYLVPAVPMLFFGWKNLQDLHDSLEK